MSDEPRAPPEHVPVEALPGAAAVLDRDRVVLAANDRWRARRSSGGQAHSHVGEPFPDVDAPEVADAVGAVLDGVRDDAECRLPGTGSTVRVRAFDADGRRHALVTTADDGWPGGAGCVLDAAADAVAVYDAGAGRIHLNGAASDIAGVSGRPVPAGSPAVERIAARASEASARALREAGRAVLDGEADDDQVEVELAPAEGPPMVLGVRLTPLSVDGERRGVVAVGRDVTSYRRELRELAQLRDARETLVRVTAIVQDLVGELVGETRRADIEAAVVEELDRSELYRFAVVGRYHPAREELLEHAAAGVDESAAREVGRVLLADHESLVRTGEVRVVDLEEADLPSAVRSNAVVVPLTYGNAVYGLLCVGIEQAGLTARELSAFGVLGDVVGFAINAAKHRRLALSDPVTELEFSVDGGGVLARLSAASDCELRVGSVVPRDEASQLQYVDVGGADPERVAAAAGDLDGVERVRRLADAPGSGALELTVADDSVLLALGERGATVEAAHAADGSAHVRAVVAAAENVRGVVEHVRSAVSTAELVAKRDVERSPEPTRVPAGAVEALTERQRAALEAAYRAGYFAYPRESTAEEVAESMGIASPTLHQHLQAAHRKLLDGVFGEDAGPPHGV